MTDFDEALRNQLSRRQAKVEANVSTILSRKQIESAFIESFELIGGVQRLAIWGNQEENYKDFLQLLMKLAPKEAIAAATGTVIEYKSLVPPSPLNNYAEVIECPKS